MRPRSRAVAMHVRWSDRTVRSGGRSSGWRTAAPSRRQRRRARRSSTPGQRAASSPIADSGFSARQPRPLQAAPKRARERHADLEGAPAGLPGGAGELALHAIFGQNVATDQLGKRHRLAEERRVARSALGRGDHGRPAGKSRLPVATEPVRVRSNSGRPGFHPAGTTGQELVQPLWQRRQPDAAQPSVATAAPVDGRSEDDLAAWLDGARAGELAGFAARISLALSAGSSLALALGSSRGSLGTEC